MLTHVFTLRASVICFVFFFNDTATTEIYTLSLHDALPICMTIAFIISLWFLYSFRKDWIPRLVSLAVIAGVIFFLASSIDRKSTRLNSSHANISYAVFCLKKKKKIHKKLIPL